VPRINGFPVILHDFEVIVEELKSFSEDLAAKPMIVVASKIDAAQDPGRIEALEAFCRERKLPFFKMSAVTGEGIDALRYELARWVKQARQAQAEARTEATVEP